MDLKYRFAKSKTKFLKYIKIIDWIGYKFHFPRKFHKIDDFNSITVVQLGHLGDFLLTLPFLYEIKNSFSKKELKIAVLPENYELAKEFDFIDEVIQIREPNFSRSYTKSYINTALDYKKIKSDLVFEVRGDLRILIFLKLFSNFKYLIGYKEGGFGFLLDYYLEYPFFKHISQTYFKFIEVLTNEQYTIKKINLPYKAVQNIPSNYIIINISSGAKSRNWDLQNFIKLAEMIAEKYDINIIFLGILKDGDFYNFSTLLEGNKYRNLMYNYVNKTSLLEAFYLIKESRFFIGLESGLTHAATFFDKDILALYSDMTYLEVWKPYQFNNKIHIIKKSVDCGYCGDLNCIDNKCMKLITVEEVFEEFEKMYKEIK